MNFVQNIYSSIVSQNRSSAEEPVSMPISVVAATVFAGLAAMCAWQRYFAPAPRFKIPLGYQKQNLPDALSPAVWLFVGEGPEYDRLTPLERLAPFREKVEKGEPLTLADLTKIQGISQLRGGQAEVDSFLKKVTALDFSHSNITDAELQNLLQHPSLAEMKAVKAVNLYRCAQVTDAGLASLRALPQLEGLQLVGCYKVTDAGFASLSALTQLRKLNLTCCYALTDAGLASLKALTQLEELNLAYCRKVTDAGLASLSALTQLRKLNLNECSHVTDAGLVSLSALPQLEELHLDCDDGNVTDAGLASWRLPSPRGLLGGLLA